jgi:hypothetical protein
VQHERLPDAGAVEDTRAKWKERTALPGSRGVFRSQLIRVIRRSVSEEAVLAACAAQGIGLGRHGCIVL